MIRSCFIQCMAAPVNGPDRPVDAARADPPRRIGIVHQLRSIHQSQRDRTRQDCRIAEGV